MLIRNVPRMSSVGHLESLAIAGENGRAWYREAHTEVTEAAALLDISPKRFADLLSLFSPRVSVRRSIRLAIRYARTGDYTTGVLSGVQRSIEHYEATGVIRGPKTRTFADALLGDGWAVVLDVWMAKAFKIDQDQFTRVGTHAECCNRVTRTAAGLFWTPAETQAAIWTTTARRAGRLPARFSIVQRSLFGDTLVAAA